MADPLLTVSPAPYIALMVIGFVLGCFGHVIRSRTAQATGIGMIFLAIVLLPLVAHLSHKG